MTSERLALPLALLVLAAYASLVPFRAPLLEVWGDEGTFLSMAESLAEDLDLRFDQRDRERLEDAELGRSTVILQRDDDGRIAYSKPVLYPLVAAPFSALLGDLGPVVLNALAFFLALMLALAYLRRLDGGERAIWVLLTFVGASVLLPYVWWRMSDLFQTSLTLAGFALCFGRWRGAAPEASCWQRLLDWRWADVLGMVLLALLTSMRVSNGALAAVPVIALILTRRFKRAALLAGVALASYLLLAALTSGLTGAPSPYRALRTSFNQQTGYPVGPEAAVSEQRFDEQMATVWTGLRPTSDPYRIGYSALYFLIGRHSGFLFYFPAGLILLSAALRWRDRHGLAMLLGFAASVVFYLGWLPWNYFGGDTFIGNRYLLAAYPALLMAPRRLPGRKALLVAWALAAVLLGSAFFSAERAHERDRTSQNHAYGGLFRLLPYESTAQALAGRQDRYWAGHFVRFVDPFARVGPWHFEIAAGDPAAELLIAHWQDLDRLQLWVSATAPGTTLTVSDYRNEQNFELGAAGSETVVEFALSPAWRKHLFWWDPQTLYRARSLRVRLSTADGSPATAQIRYLRHQQIWEEAFAYDLLAAEVPKTGVAGGGGTARLRLRNTSLQTWRPKDVFPVYAKYRLYEPSAAVKLLHESPPIPLPAPVPPQHEVELPIDIEWPAAGRYRLEIDLILSRIGWFQERVGQPVIRQEIEVLRSAEEPLADAVE